MSHGHWYQYLQHYSCAGLSFLAKVSLANESTYAVFHHVLKGFMSFYPTELHDTSFMSLDLWFHVAIFKVLRMFAQKTWWWTGTEKKTKHEGNIKMIKLVGIHPKHAGGTPFLMFFFGQVKHDGFRGSIIHFFCRHHHQTRRPNT